MVQSTMKGKQKKKRNPDEDDDSIGGVVKDLILRMQEAIDTDKINNKKGKPALLRLQISSEVYNQLRKNQIQEKFLEYGGCRIFAEWLD